jgi:hypothetical protein
MSDNKELVSREPGEISKELSLSDIFQGNGMGRLWTTLPSDGSRSAAVVVENAMSDAESIRDHIGAVLEIENVLLHDVVIEGENGEDVPAVRAVLIDSKGQGYAAVSNGVISSLQTLMALCGPGPWNPPLKVVPREVKTRKGYRTLRLKLVE